MNFTEAAEWFFEKADQVAAAKEQMLIVGAAIVEAEAKNELGTYQTAAGPFIAWADLAPSTQARREQLGYEPNDPLLMTGKLKDSIQTVVTDDVAMVGTDLPYASDLEYGTSKIPPRPFLGRAGWVKQDEIAEVQAEIIETILNL